MKLLTYLISITALLALWACTEDPYSPDAEAGKIFKINNQQSILRFTYDIGTPYLLKIKLDNTYTEFDSIVVTGKFKKSNQPAIKFYNDGGTNPNSHDLVPNNDIWTAYYQPSDTDSTTRDSLIFTAKLYSGSNVITSTFQRYSMVKEATAPLLESIGGITAGDVLFYLAPNQTVPQSTTIKIYTRDADNPIVNNATLYEDTLKAYMDLLDSNYNKVKTDTITSPYLWHKDSLKFIYQPKPTLSAGEKTHSKYKLSFYIEDSYGKVSNSKIIENIKVTNNPPSTSNFICPDSVYLPATATSAPNIYPISLVVKDPQGTAKDIDSVRAYFENDTSHVKSMVKLYDDGNSNHNDATSNDGIYSFFIITEFGKPIIKYNVTLYAWDKASNRSVVLKDSVYQRPTPTKFKGKK